MAIRKSYTGVAAVALSLALTGFGTAGCSSKSSSCSDFSGSIQKSVSGMEANAGDPAAFVKSAQDVSKQLHDKANSASDSKVKDAINQFATDWDTLITKMQAVQSGDTSGASDIASLSTKIQADTTTLENVCK